VDARPHKSHYPINYDDFVLFLENNQRCLGCARHDRKVGCRIVCDRKAWRNLLSDGERNGRGLRRRSRFIHAFFQPLPLGAIAKTGAGAGSSVAGSSSASARDFS